MSLRDKKVMKVKYQDGLIGGLVNFLQLLDNLYKINQPNIYTFCQ